LFGKVSEVKHTCLLVLAAFWAPDGGHQLSQELAWVVPPGWVRVEIRSDIAAHDPHDPFAVVAVIHTVPAVAGRRIEVDFLRKALIRFPTRGTLPPAATLGTCSDGQVRFACEELQIRLPDRLDIAYAWVDEGRGWGFSARYTVPRGREEEMLSLVRRVVGWTATQSIHE